MKTKVKFYKIGGDILAVFPDLVFDNKGNITCYAHIGQHSACSKEYLKGKKLAAPSEYADLLRELIGQGYDDLEVIDSRNTLSKILEPVNSKYGAPMGRSNVLPQNYSIVDMGAPHKFLADPITIKSKRIFDSKVPLSNDGAYDIGGAYWGLGNELRVQYTKDLSFVRFYRKGEL